MLNMKIVKRYLELNKLEFYLKDLDLFQDDFKEEDYPEFYSKIEFNLKGELPRFVDELNATLPK